MPEKVLKHLKVVQQCVYCRKKFTNRLLVSVSNNFKIEDLNLAVKNHPDKLHFCPNCASNNIKTTYSFYHEQKL